MEFFTEEDAARAQEDSVDIITGLGTTRLILRQPLPATSSLDPDFKSPVSMPDKLPFLERPIIAKVRPLSDAEVQATAVGELKKGDLVVDFDPRLYDDPIRPLSNLDEIRFEQHFVTAEGIIDPSWDFTVQDVRPNFGRHLCIKLRGHIRRKQILTQGGSLPQDTAF